MCGRYPRRQMGQSLPLLALMMIVLIGFVGFSVDAGHAYAQQRRMQSAANAGALGGLNTWLATKTDPTGWTNAKVWANVKQALAGNRVGIDQASYTYRADYIVAKSTTTIPLGSWNGATESVTNSASTPPANIDRIRVKVTYRLDTFFARAVGRDTLTVNGVGDACWGNYGLGIMPIAMPGIFQQYDDKADKDKDKDKDKGSPLPTPTPTPPDPYHRLFLLKDNNGDGEANAGDQLGAEQSWPFPAWDTDAMRGKILFQPISNDDDLTGTHIGWLSWTGNNGANELGDSLTLPGNIDVSFEEGPIPDEYSSLPIAAIDKRFQPKDWVNGDTGVKGGEADELEALLYKDIILPIYDAAGKVGGKSSFHSSLLGKYRIVGFDLSQPKGFSAPSDVKNGDKYIMIQYLGPATEGTASGCAAATP